MGRAAEEQRPPSERQEGPEGSYRRWVRRELDKVHSVCQVGQRGWEGKEPGCLLHPWKDDKTTWGGRLGNQEQKCLAGYQVQAVYRARLTRRTSLGGWLDSRPLRSP